MPHISDTVKTLLIANILFFLGSQYIIGDQVAVQKFALWFPENENFEFWQIITHMFMHGNFTHILFNMFGLWMFGSIMEQTLQQKRFLFLYFAAGFGAAALQLIFTYYNFNTGFKTLVDAGMSTDEVYKLIADATSQMSGTGEYSVGIPQNVNEGTIQSMLGSYMTPMVGASGAVFGILAAFAIIYPNLDLYLFFIPVPIKAKYLIGGYFVMEVYSGITNTSILGPSNTAHWAHVGGAVIGFITMWYWKKKKLNQNHWH